MTAAHCVVSRDVFPANGVASPNEVQVWIGVNNRQQDRSGDTNAR